MHTIRSSADKADFELRKMRTENKLHIKYASFKNSTKVDKIAGLALSRLINVHAQHEWLNDATVLTNAKYKGTKGSLGQMIMNVK